ncbi:MAG: hypothetical protein Q9195_003472 [Heterodermia aff. obscurata]
MHRVQGTCLFAEAQKRVWRDVDDEAPTYVDEQSQDVVSKEAYEAMISRDKPAASNQTDSPGSAEMGDDTQKVTSSERTAEKAIPKEATASIGKSRKKRLAKVVGDGSEIVQTGDKHDVEASPERAKRVKKSKRIKLSFDEVE